MAAVERATGGVVRREVKRVSRQRIWFFFKYKRSHWRVENRRVTSFKFSKLSLTEVCCIGTGM